MRSAASMPSSSAANGRAHSSSTNSGAAAAARIIALLRAVASSGMPSISVRSPGGMRSGGCSTANALRAQRTQGSIKSAIWLPARAASGSDAATMRLVLTAPSCATQLCAVRFSCMCQLVHTQACMLPDDMKHCRCAFMAVASPEAGRGASAKHKPQADQSLGSTMPSRWV